MSKQKLSFEEIMDRIICGGIALIPLGFGLWAFSKFLVSIVNMWR